MSDLWLREQVLEELEFDPVVNAAHIGVAAEKGVITLAGHVGSYSEKLAALAAVRRVRGVRAVADELRVRFPEEKKIADDEIAKRAADILDWDTTVPRGAIEVTVRDGWVTLAGDVNWEFQRKAAEDDVRKLSGIFGLTNNIAIKPQIEAGDVKRKIEDALKRHAQVEAQAIYVTVREGDKVVLEGKVNNLEERNAVQNAAWSAPGVRSVEDRLVIA